MVKGKSRCHNAMFLSILVRGVFCRHSICAVKLIHFVMTCDLIFEEVIGFTCVHSAAHLTIVSVCLFEACRAEVRKI